MNRGAGSNLKVYGHTSLARRTGKKVCCASHFSVAPPRSLRWHSVHQGGHKPQRPCIKRWASHQVIYASLRDATVPVPLEASEGGRVRQMLIVPTFKVHLGIWLRRLWDWDWILSNKRRHWNTTMHSSSDESKSGKTSIKSILCKACWMSQKEKQCLNYNLSCTMIRTVYETNPQMTVLWTREQASVNTWQVVQSDTYIYTAFMCKRKRKLKGSAVRLGQKNSIRFSDLNWFF